MRLDSNYQVYQNIGNTYNKYDDELFRKHNEFKMLVHNGSEVRCEELSNYVIDTNSTNVVLLEFQESFSSRPEIFVTVNGFHYEPHLGLGKDFVQYLSFQVMEVKETSFRIKIESQVVSLKEGNPIENEGFFRMKDFDRIDICYFAFINSKMEKDERNLKD